MYKEVKCERSNLNIREFLPNIDFRFFLKIGLKHIFLRCPLHRKLK